MDDENEVQSLVSKSMVLMDDNHFNKNRYQQTNMIDNYSSVTSTIVMHHVCKEMTYKIDYNILNNDLFQDTYQEGNSYKSEEDLCDVGSNHSDDFINNRLNTSNTNFTNQKSNLMEKSISLMNTNRAINDKAKPYL